MVVTALQLLISLHMCDYICSQHGSKWPLSSESFSALACFEKRVLKGPRAGASPETYESLVKSLVLPGEITESIDQVESG